MGSEIIPEPPAGGIEWLQKLGAQLDGLQGVFGTIEQFLLFVMSKGKLIEGVGGLRIMRDVGAKVHRLKHLKLHGKMLLADEARAIIGSINLAPGSFGVAGFEDAAREYANYVKASRPAGLRVVCCQSIQR